MNFFIAFIVSVIIHLGVYFYFINSKEFFPKVVPKKPEGKVSTTVQYVKIKPKENKINPKPKEISKKVPKTITKPKIIELPKKFQPIKPNKKIPKEKIIEKPKKQEIQQEDKKILENLDSQTKEYLELYDNFDQFPQKTKLFLIKNIKDIGFITQRYLIYPMMSVQAGQEGVNVVEFILYPNGEITVPRIIQSSKYFLLDDNTKETILEAYKDYPRPQKPTPIRIFVKYKLIRN